MKPNDDDRGLNFGCGAVTVLLCLILAMLILWLLAGCGSAPAKPYNRTAINKGFTDTNQAITDASRYTQDAKGQVRQIGTNADRIDNKAGVILKYWDKAR